MDDNNISGESKGRTKPQKTGHLGFSIIFVLLLTLLFISVYTFILQSNYSDSMLRANVEWNSRCSDAIHKLVSNIFTREDYENITTVDDMETDRYKELQQMLNELRTLNSTRYLYTAKRGDDGRLIYLIDGLDLDAEDFAYPGTYIEDEMIPYIDAALSGETIYSQEIMDTTWGHIFTACYPVREAGSDEIIGALCMEMDMENSYVFLNENKQATIKAAVIAILIAALMAVCVYIGLRKQRIREKERQQMLNDAAVAAEAANKAKSTFLFNMSHDIRTPMNAIIGYAELAGRNMYDAGKLGGYLVKIQVCGKKMLSLLDNVLELSRIESGKVTIEESPVKSGAVFDDCMLMIRAEADKKHQLLTTSKSIISPYIFFDTARVTEMVLNLVSNAIKYTPEGGKIHCSIKQYPHPDEGWVYQEFSVEDNGIGMSEEFQKHIYESFARERSTTMSGIEGTGLGMGIVKNLVDLMNGTISIKSQVGEGSTFTFRIPCRVASYEDTRPKRAVASFDENKIKGKKILLAEDNDLNAEIATELLTEEGFEVDRAEDGVKCFELLEKAPAGHYSIILMDIQMPVLDGYDATSKIRKMSDPEKANIPIIAMTANAFAEDRKRALDVGMNDHIAKPIDMNVLIPTLEKYL